MAQKSELMGSKKFNAPLIFLSLYCLLLQLKAKILSGKKEEKDFFTLSTLTLKRQHLTKLKQAMVPDTSNQRIGPSRNTIL